jgi:hypothetical protein
MEQLDTEAPQVIDGQTGKVEPIPRTINLSNARDLRLEMAYLYRRCDGGEIESGEMNRRIWALGEMLKAYEVQEFEKRLQEIEDRQQAIQQQRALPAPARTLN